MPRNLIVKVSNNPYNQQDINFNFLTIYLSCLSMKAIIINKNRHTCQVLSRSFWTDSNLLSCIYSVFIKGTCVDLVNNYTCNCNVGFTGANCKLVIKNCTEDSCFPSVTCFKNSYTISCGPCPLGFAGDGKNCKGISIIIIIIIIIEKKIK